MLQVDGFRFDIMGHLMLSTMKKIQAALAKLTLDKDGVDGKGLYIYGEAWDFGEVRFPTRLLLLMAVCACDLSVCAPLAPVYSSVCQSVSLSGCLSVCLPLCLPISLCQSLCQPLHPFDLCLLSQLILCVCGWQVSSNQRGVNASQLNIGGTGLGSFNDRFRDAVVGGSPFASPLFQGCVTGQALFPLTASHIKHGWISKSSNHVQSSLLHSAG